MTSPWRRAVLGWLAAAIAAGRARPRRSVALLLLGAVTLVEAAAAGALIAGVVASPVRMSEIPHDAALLLLRDGALVWLANVLTFACWYWELDGGGPARRQAGYRSSDVLFPQMSLAGSQRDRWAPHFVDYLFLAFNTSTAFSPTDTQVLSVRVKLLMILQSLISVAVLVVVAARAINTL